MQEVGSGLWGLVVEIIVQNEFQLIGGVTNAIVLQASVDGTAGIFLLKIHKQKKS